MTPHSTNDEDRTVVVVGAGLAGLTAAATAAGRGARVIVLEAREHPGGRARTTTVGGFHLNQGAHALYRGGPAVATLAELGITPRGSMPDASCALGVRADGALGRLPADLRSLVHTDLFGWRTKVGLARVLGRPSRLAGSARAAHSARDWIEAQSRDADLRAALALMIRTSTYCSELDALDARAGIAQFLQAQEHGVLYLDDGWQQLVEALHEVGRSRGVVVHERTKVVALEPRGDAWIVRTTDDELEADAVVHAAGGPVDVDDVLHGTSAAVHAWARRERPVYASTLDVALRALPVPDRRIVFGLAEPLYLSVHTPAARLVDGPGEVAHLLWYGDAADDPRPRLEGLLDRAQPGWRDEVVELRAGRRLVVAHGRPLPGTGLAGRPTSTVPDTPGLFVAGDWVGPVGFLGDAVFASGRAAGVGAASTPAPDRRVRA
jgi:phytoene dehydrogenase-like protein